MEIAQEDGGRRETVLWSSRLPQQTPPTSHDGQNLLADSPSSSSSSPGSESGRSLSRRKWAGKSDSTGTITARGSLLRPDTDELILSVVTAVHLQMLQDYQVLMHDSSRLLDHYEFNDFNYPAPIVHHKLASSSRTRQRRSRRRQAAIAAEPQAVADPWPSSLHEPPTSPQAPAPPTAPAVPAPSSGYQASIGSMSSVPSEQGANSVSCASPMQRAPCASPAPGLLPGLPSLDAAAPLPFSQVYGAQGSKDGVHDDVAPMTIGAASEHCIDEPPCHPTEWSAAPQTSWPTQRNSVGVSAQPQGESKAQPTAGSLWYGYGANAAASSSQTCTPGPSLHSQVTFGTGMAMVFSNDPLPPVAAPALVPMSSVYSTVQSAYGQVSSGLFSEASAPVLQPPKPTCGPAWMDLIAHTTQNSLAVAVAGGGGGGGGGGAFPSAPAGMPPTLFSTVPLPQQLAAPTAADLVANVSLMAQHRAPFPADFHASTMVPTTLAYPPVPPPAPVPKPTTASHSSHTSLLDVTAQRFTNGLRRPRDSPVSRHSWNTGPHLSGWQHGPMAQGGGIQGGMQSGIPGGQGYQWGVAPTRESAPCDTPVPGSVSKRPAPSPVGSPFLDRSKAPRARDGSRSFQETRPPERKQSSHPESSSSHADEVERSSQGNETPQQRAWKRARQTGTNAPSMSHQRDQEGFLMPVVRPQPVIGLVPPPPLEQLYDFAFDLYNKAQFSSPCNIVALVLVNRLLAQTGMLLHAYNWKPVLLVAFLLAQKVWDDRCLNNGQFSILCPRFSASQVNRMEAAFLEATEYDVSLSSRTYAKYYFELRSLFMHGYRRPFTAAPLLGPQDAQRLEARSSARGKRLWAEHEQKRRRSHNAFYSRALLRPGLSF